MTGRAYPCRRHQAGAGLVTAIFLLVVLAGLATALVSIFGTQRQSSALDEQGARAYQAARAGIEWAIFRRSTDAANYCPAGATTASRTDSFALPAASTMAGFVVTVTCTMVPGPASDNTDMAPFYLSRWTIRATACTTGGAACPAPSNSRDYVERVIEVQL